MSRPQSDPAKAQTAGRTTRRLGRLMTYAGVLILVLLAAWLAFKARRVYVIYQDLAPRLTSLRALASGSVADAAQLDLPRLESDLEGIAVDLDRLYEESAPFLPLTRYLGWVPTYGGDIRAAPYLLKAGRDVARAGLTLFELFRPMLEEESGAEQSGGLSQAFRRLVESQADIGEARQLLKQAQINLSQVDGERLSPKIASQVGPLRQYLPLAVSALEAAERLPSLLGAESPQTYLLLTQNSDELRPTGGYINAAGHLVVDKGQIAEFVMQDSYAVDQISEAYPYPPDPIRQYMAADYWLLRDANWSPDFPTTARTAIELYALGQGISAHGVIAVDLHALSDVLRAFGPLEIQGEQVTAENVVEILRQQWTRTQDQQLEDWWPQRKSFMLSLAQTLCTRLEQGPGEINLSLLAAVLSDALAEKHILVYVDDPLFAHFLAEQNWDGALPAVQGDYLMVVDANLGFNKASALVDRRLTYQVALAEDGSAQAQAHLEYQHRAQKGEDPCRQEPRYDVLYEQNMERCYWNYLRLIVPAGAQLLDGPRNVVDGQFLLRGQSTTGEIDRAPLDPDKMSWGQLTLLPIGESLSLEYVYHLPPNTARRLDDTWIYQLNLQKQPGTLAPPVEVVVTLPDGTQYVDSLPEPDSQAGNVVTYSLSLATDQRIQLFYR
jgi:hypothetical protein